MALARKIGSFTVKNVQAIIRRNAEWDEYIVTLHIDGIHQQEADYHTQYLEDARRTARTMAYGAAGE